MAETHRHSRNRRALAIALAITVTFAVVELAGGLIAGSLTLLADAAHMATDVLALGLSLFAVWAAGRPTTQHKTYGYLRAEILAALGNGAALIAIAGWIAWEAVHRYATNSHVAGGPMVDVGLAGLLANLASATVLLRSEHDNLNVQGRCSMWRAIPQVRSVRSLPAASFWQQTGTRPTRWCHW
jgi:cobalt-zinc-cadmium efflux system protein